MDNQYTYESAGFDNFLSRSVDSTPQLNLDSQVPSNNAVAFDRTQVTGSQGDTYAMGGISMAAKDSTITLNDGALRVNDTSTNSSVQASSGNIAYYDNSGNLVVQEGLLPDNSTGIRIIDSQQVGLAQFGKFKDGTTALKVAKPNIEVSTARDDQLIFNSSQDIFKVAKTGTTSGTTSDGSQSLALTIPHGLSSTPGVVAFCQPPTGNFNPFTIQPTFGGGWVQVPFTIYIVNVAIQNSTSTDILPVLSYYAEVDGSNVTLRGYQYITGMTSSSFSVNFRYYILQETAN